MATGFNCRVCGSIPSIGEERPAKAFEEVASVYYILTELQRTSEEAAFSTTVCNPCYSKLMEIAEFRSMCMQSYKRMTAAKKTVGESSSYGMSRSYEAQNWNQYDTFGGVHNQSGHYLSALRGHEHMAQGTGSQASIIDTMMFNVASSSTAVDRSDSARSSVQVHVQQSQTVQSQGKANSNGSAPAESPVTRADLDHIHQRLDHLGSKMDANSVVLQRIERLIFKAGQQPQQQQQQQGQLNPFDPATARVEELKARNNEDYSEFEQMFRIVTGEQLVELENNLADPAFESKLFRYFQSVYSLNGKREGFPFFKTVLRKMLVPTVLIPFSWKGNSRVKKGDLQSTTVVIQEKNQSFRNMFPNFVKFIHRIVSAGDFEYTNEANEKAFSEYLRQKNTEVKRFFESNGVQRASSTRRKRKKPRVTEEFSPDLEREEYPPNDTNDTGDVFSCDDETMSETGEEVDVNIKEEAAEYSHLNMSGRLQ